MENHEAIEQLRTALAGRVELRGVLGRGGMATVLLARDLKHDRLVALKALAHGVATRLDPERFLREIALTARLRHPHILPVLDSGNDAGLLWFTMPLVESGSLRTQLRAGPPMPLEKALALCEDVAGALDYAHSEGVLHRDVKPENILIHAGEAMLSDFGIAQQIDADARLTSTGLVVGTPAYMSPEQRAGATRIDGRSDQYSLACVAQELLSVGTEHSLARPSGETVPLKASEATAVAGTALCAAEQEVLSRALSVEPAARYATCGEFMHALKLASSSRGVPAKAVARARPEAGTVRRLVRVAMLTIGAAAALVVLLLGWAFFDAQRHGETLDFRFRMEPKWSPKLGAISLEPPNGTVLSRRALRAGQAITVRLHSDGANLNVRPSEIDKQWGKVQLWWAEDDNHMRWFGRRFRLDEVRLTLWPQDIVLRGALRDTMERHGRIRVLLTRTLVDSTHAGSVTSSMYPIQSFDYLVE